MWIKICANTNLEDARLAAELGADALGFVFAESARQVVAQQVAKIVSHLPAEVEKIGVFSSHNAEEIIAIVRDAGLTGVQLHGSLNLELVRQLNAEFNGKVQIIQTLHWSLDPAANNAEEIAAQLQQIDAEPAIDCVLLDSKKGSASGGTGLTFDWAAARSALKPFNQLKLIAAGGLHPGNVAQAIEELNPWGVDVASGVEASKGRKNPQKLEQFIKNVRRI